MALIECCQDESKEHTVLKYVLLLSLQMNACIKPEVCFDTNMDFIILVSMPICVNFPVLMIFATIKMSLLNDDLTLLVQEKVSMASDFVQKARSHGVCLFELSHTGRSAGSSF